MSADWPGNRAAQPRTPPAIRRFGGIAQPPRRSANSRDDVTAVHLSLDPATRRPGALALPVWRCSAHAGSSLLLQVLSGDCARCRSISSLVHGCDHFVLAVVHCCFEFMRIAISAMLKDKVE